MGKISALRMAKPNDCPGILALLDKYYVENSSTDQLSQGFISIRFTEAHMLEMIEFPGVTVACSESQEIVAVACLSILKFEHRNASEFVNSFFTLLLSSSYEGKKLTSYDLAMYGPVCVDAEYSGKGIAQRLFYHSKQALNQHGFDVGLLFIDHVNTRSMHVHLHKLSVHLVGTFHVGDKSYALGLFPTGL